MIQNAQVKVTSEKGITQTVNTDSEGNWVVNGMPSGNVKIEAGARGFQTQIYDKAPYDAAQPPQYSTSLGVGSVSQTVEVTATAPINRH